jgi:hypothetical protein
MLLSLQIRTQPHLGCCLAAATAAASAIFMQLDVAQLDVVPKWPWHAFANVTSTYTARTHLGLAQPAMEFNGGPGKQLGQGLHSPQQKASSVRAKGRASAPFSRPSVLSPLLPTLPIVAQVDQESASFIRRALASYDMPGCVKLQKALAIALHGFQQANSRYPLPLLTQQTASIPLPVCPLIGPQVLSPLCH